MRRFADLHNAPGEQQRLALMHRIQCAIDAQPSDEQKIALIQRIQDARSATDNVPGSARMTKEEEDHNRGKCP